MRDGVIYDCRNANCTTPIYTGKCSKACIEKYNKEMGIKPMTNSERIRAMSDEDLAGYLIQYRDDWDDYYTPGCNFFDTYEEAMTATIEWLKQPVEEKDNA